MFFIFPEAVLTTSIIIILLMALNPESLKNSKGGIQIGKIDNQVLSRISKKTQSYMYINRICNHHLYTLHSVCFYYIYQKSSLTNMFISASMLKLAYSRTDECLMANDISEIMDICLASGNPHLLWFGELLYNHFEGIIAHATYNISASKIEGINNKIKTIRRQCYGYPDDEYFFLKLFDISRRKYVRNIKSHKICD